MSLRQFLTGVLLTILVQVVMIGLLMLVAPSLMGHLGFVVTSMVVLLLFCMVLFLVARMAAGSQKGSAFIQLIMVAVFLKILVCLALIIGYTKGFSPPDHTFVWPFLIIYITSTIYEVIFLEKTARQTKPNAS